MHLGSAWSCATCAYLVWRSLRSVHVLKREDCGSKHWRSLLGIHLGPFKNSSTVISSYCAAFTVNTIHLKQPQMRISSVAGTESVTCHLWTGAADRQATPMLSSIYGEALSASVMTRGPRGRAGRAHECLWVLVSEWLNAAPCDVCVRGTRKKKEIVSNIWACVCWMILLIDASFAACKLSLCACKCKCVGMCVCTFVGIHLWTSLRC